MNICQRAYMGAYYALTHPCVVVWRTWKNPKSHGWKDGREILTSDEWNEIGNETYKNDWNFKPNYVI